MLWVLLFIFAAFGACFIVDDWLVWQKKVARKQQAVNGLKASAFFLLESISVGALVGLVSFGIGCIFSWVLGSGWSFAGIISLNTGFGLFGGLCGLIIGCGLAFHRYVRALW